MKTILSLCLAALLAAAQSTPPGGSPPPRCIGSRTANCVPWADSSGNVAVGATLPTDAVGGTVTAVRQFSGTGNTGAAMYVSDTAGSSATLINNGDLLRIDGQKTAWGANHPFFRVARDGGTYVWDYFSVLPYADKSFCPSSYMGCFGSDLSGSGITLAITNGIGSSHPIFEFRDAPVGATSWATSNARLKLSSAGLLSFGDLLRGVPGWKPDGNQMSARSGDDSEAASVKASTVLLDSIGLGPDLVVNGAFSADTDWTKTTGWTISGGTAVATAAATYFTIQQHIPSLVFGHTYKCTYTAVTRSAGSFGLQLSQDGIGVTHNAAGTYTDYLTPTNAADNQLYIAAVSGPLTATFDNLSCQEITSNGVRTAPLTFSRLMPCAAANEGTMAAVSDASTATWGETITGGSTNHVLAYCNGSVWTVAAK